MLAIWTQPSGYTFTNNGQPFQEQIAVDIPLPVQNDNGITYTVISGNLPEGLRISGNHIVGNPFIIANNILYTFCIRASDGTRIADRTFSMQVNGASPPEFITAAGDLAVGPSKQLYALDGTYISYQIEAFDLNMVIGANLKYFIASGDGALPPGLTMTDAGLISGFITPKLITTPENGDGAFDDTFFDDAGYDFANPPTDGFDTYLYDNINFDYNSPTTVVKSLNANYQFRITVTDGISYAQRVFKIFVVGSDQFRADSTSYNGFVNDQGFTADSTFLRTPVWLSDKNLGTYRSNSYLTVPIVLYDSTNTLFRLEATNCEVYAVTKKFSINDNIANSNNVTVTNFSSVPVVGQYLTFNNYVPGATEKLYQIATVKNLNVNTLIVQNVSGNGKTATVNFNLQSSPPFTVGERIVVTGVTPIGFNGSYTVLRCTVNSVTYANPTVEPLAIDSVYGNGTTAILSFARQVTNLFQVGQQITVTGATPSGFNGTYTVTASNLYSVSYSNSTVITDIASLGSISGGASSLYPGGGFINNYGEGFYRLTLDQPLEINLPDFTPFYIGSPSVLPLGTSFDVNTGEIYGRMPYQPAITKTYDFTITATRINADDTEQLFNVKSFNITILGSITSQLTWNSPSLLGTIPADYICTLAINATSTISDAVIVYSLIDGKLPPGLTLNLDGTIVGTPNQYYNSSTGVLGLTTFHDTDIHGVRYNNQTFDNGATTIDRNYTFTVTAGDQYQYSAISQKFTISITTPNTVPYSNITAQPFLTPTQRALWQSFINNNSVFTPSSIYRTNDKNFGIQQQLTMLVYAGIQTENAAAYVGAMGIGVKKKRFKFGSVNSAVAVDPSTGNEIYEVVYVQMIDPLEPNGKHLPLSIKTTSVESQTITIDESTISARPNPYITVDSTGYQSSNSNTDVYFPSSITNWQTRLSQTTDHFKTVNGQQVSVPALSERNYLPLWMRSIQSGSKAQLGYVLCVPLCFCKPGTASTIVTNIAFNGFNFNNIDYTVDRFTISAVTGDTSDKYLIFRDDRITV